MIDNYNYSSQSLILITAIDLTQIPSLFISQPQMWDFSSSKLEFCSWQKRAQTRFPNNRWASSHISLRAEPPLLNRHFFSRLDQHIISKNPSWLSFARKGPPRSQLHSRKCLPTRSDWWVEETTIIPRFNDMSGAADKEAEMHESLCVFTTEPKNTCLRCRLGAISNNRAPRFPRWELESLWILFSRLSRVPGDQGGDAQRPTLRGRRLPKRPLSPPCCARWQVSVGLLQAVPKSQDTAHTESRLLRILLYAIGPISRRRHCHGESEERKVTRQERSSQISQLFFFPMHQFFLK